MPLWGIVLLVLGGVAVLVLLITLICFLVVFYAPKRTPAALQKALFPTGEIYEPFYELFDRWRKEAHAIPHEEVAIASYDGLTLRGEYYECVKGGPVEVLMPGYRGSADRDLCGGVQRCFSLGHNALIVDQRSGGYSDGRVITFGVKERYDCLAWVQYLTARFGADTPIILTGISMGAATVMMATALDLPDNVVGVLADCGYTSPKAIIQKVMRQIKVPVWLLYPFITLAARLFAGFDLEAASPVEAMRQCRLPVVFVHGEADDYVPLAMSCENYEACQGPKVLLTVPCAGHGLSYPVDPEGYVKAIRRGLVPAVKNVEIG